MNKKGGIYNMFSVIQTGSKITPGLVELIIDKEADLISLPTHYAPGSTCIVAENSNVYILNNEKVWKLL